MFLKTSLNLRRVFTIIMVAMALSLSACSSPEEKAQAHLESGQELLAKNEYVKAGLEFRNAIKFNDKLIDAWIGLSSVYEHAGNWSGFNSTLTNVLELDPSHFESVLRMAQLQLVWGDIDKSLEFINKANELKPDNSDVLATRAATLLRFNDREGTRRDGERALALNKENANAYAILATERMLDGDFKNGLLLIDRGLAADEKNLALLLLKVKVFEQQKDDIQLEAVLRRLLTFHPDQVSVRRALISMLVNRKRLDEAEAELRALAAADPANSDAALEVVRFMLAHKGIGFAQAELERLIKQYPNKIVYSFSLAELYFDHKRIDQAKGLLAAIIAKGEPAKDVRSARLQLARWHLGLKDTDAAMRLIEEVLAVDENNPGALGLRAAIGIDANDIDNAILDLRNALTQRPQSFSLASLLGKAFERQGSIALAEEWHGRAASKSQFSPEITLSYFEFLILRGKADKAEELLTKALRYNPINSKMLTRLASLRLNKGDWAGAEQVAQTLKNLEGQGVASEQIFGAILFGQKKFDQSVEVFKNAYAQGQVGALRPMMGVVVSYARIGKIGDAERFIEAVLEANADNAEALVLKGWLKQQQKQPEEVVTAYKEAIRRQPASAVGYIALADYYMAGRNSSEAEAVLKRGREKNADNLSLGLRLASIKESRGDVDGAIAIYEELLALKPDVPILANNLASLLSNYRNDDASLARAYDLSKKLEIPGVPQFKDTVGWIAYRRGDYEAAAANLKQAAERQPNQSVVRYHLGMTLIALKQTEAAQIELTKALELIKKDDPLFEKVQTALTLLASDSSKN